MAHVNSECASQCLTIRGVVQGVGFRPFVYRLARSLGLAGWVRNVARGVEVHLEGRIEHLAEFRARVVAEAPSGSIILAVKESIAPLEYLRGFQVLETDGRDGGRRYVPPDLAVCPACVRELFDPANRRFRYPFINCTACGPRFSLITAMPYERMQTSMRRFAMCADCRREFADPQDRRFHAEVIACACCGPQLALWDLEGRAVAGGDDALLRAAAKIKSGEIVAVKGLGGFHLLADARSEAAVARLRERKHRPTKPLAVMFPSLEDVRRCCELSENDERLFTSREAPIVLVPKAAGAPALAENVAPSCGSIGAFLPYTPVHHLLLAELRSPVIATSGNLSDEPICIDNAEALSRLRGIADFFLVHDRPIVRPVDDSVVRVIGGREMMLRRARGFAPLPLPAAKSATATLTLGAQLKNSVALAVDGDASVSQHIGDLSTVAALQGMLSAANDLERLSACTPARVIVDAHPDYSSRPLALELGLPVFAVQHHQAHALACLVENGLSTEALAVVWDGAGYGSDGTIWGGEFIRVSHEACVRLAHLRPFPLPGGDAAAREPRRSALGLLHACFGAEWPHPAEERIQDMFAPPELAPLRQMLARGVNAPLCSSMGRLFDAVAALLGLCGVSTYEGEAAVRLEYAASGSRDVGEYPFPLGNEERLDCAPLLRAMLEDLQQGRAVAEIAASFHQSLAEAILLLARRVSLPDVLLTGGCFQNKLLAELAIERLRSGGFRPHWHRRVPPNDGGISLGQIAAAAKWPSLLTPV